MWLTKLSKDGGNNFSFPTCYSAKHAPLALKKWNLFIHHTGSRQVLRLLRPIRYAEVMPCNFRGDGIVSLATFSWVSSIAHS